MRRSAVRPLVAESSSRVLGVDASLSSTGYAYMQGSKLITGRITTGNLRDAHRLFYVELMLSKVLDVAKPTLVAYEDYAKIGRAHV